MRDTLDAILLFIGSTSLTDSEWNSIEQEGINEPLNQYNELLKILLARESVSSTSDRLAYYFRAMGLTIGDPNKAKSNIFVGASLGY